MQREAFSTIMSTFCVQTFVQFLKHASALRRWWNPELLFTGVSVMQINPKTGKHLGGALCRKWCKMFVKFCMLAVGACSS